MAKQKIRPARRGSFLGVKTYIKYVEILKNCCNTAGRTFLRRHQLPPSSRDRAAEVVTASIKVVRKPFFSRVLTPAIAVPPGEQT